MQIDADNPAVAFVGAQHAAPHLGEIADMRFILSF
jgi:hypothetical protein